MLAEGFNAGPLHPARPGWRSGVSEGTDAAPEAPEFDQRLALLLAMAMFVLVVDTSLMNVSISAVVHDLGTTVSAVQSAIALEALVSAAFILIGSKVGDLIGRKKAYVLGLLAYAVGALAMTLAQSVTVIVVFWAVVGGLGASLLLPAMQSLIHGNFEGAAQKRVYALVGASAAIAAAVGPLLGGFITTFLSWRVGFALEVVIIAVVLSGIGRVRDVPYTGPRHIDLIGSVLSVLGMGGIVLGVLVWQEGGEAVGVFLAVGAVALGSLGYWLVRRKRDGKPTLIDPDLFRSKMFRFGVTGQMMQQIALGGAMIALPIFLQMVLEYNAMQTGLSIAPLSLTMFGVALLAGKKAGSRRPSAVIRAGFALLAVGMTVIIAIVPRADSGWYLLMPLVIAGAGLGLLVSQLNNFTLSPIDEERVSEAAGVNSASGSFGLSFGLAFAGAIMLGTLAISFTDMAESSAVFTPTEQQQVADGLEKDAEILSNSQLEELLVDQPHDIQAEIIRINTDAREIALQVALLVPLLAALFGLFTAFRMARLPDPAPSESADGVVLG
jgi:EmrB/QacA subfamily drug resistance transporter